MTCEPDSRLFGGSLPMSCLVLVNMRTANAVSKSKMGIGRTNGFAGVIANCHSALTYARHVGLPVIHVCGNEIEETSDACCRWLNGFAPEHDDAVLYRKTGSCYSSPFFSDKVQENGNTIVMAGFLGRGGSLMTGADAYRAGHRITFLSDAIYDDLPGFTLSQNSIQLLRTYAHFAVEVQSTGRWIDKVSHFPVSKTLSTN